MKLSDIPPKELRKKAREEGIRFKTGPFPVRLKTDIPELIDTLHSMYGHASLLCNNEVSQFHITIAQKSGLRRWLKPQAIFSIDGIKPFEPYPLSHAFPLFEWGLNWCIGTTAHNNLMLHSAVVEKNGIGLILPAMPGSGKSTLCAGLTSRGWRLLSDEFGILRHSDGQLLPIPRAAPLKNDSIEIIRQYAPEAVLGPIYEKTRKGTVSHMAPPPNSLELQEQTVTPKFVVFPKYQKGAKTRLTPLVKSAAFTRLTNNAFNYQVTMEQGFQSMARLVENTQCFDFISGDLDEAVITLQTLLEHE